MQGGGGSRRGKKRKDTGDSDLKDDMPFDSRGADNWPENLGKFLRLKSFCVFLFHFMVFLHLE